MKAIRIHAYGGPEVMQLEELPTPSPGPGEALVRIHAASVNFLDVQRRRGELVGQAFYSRHTNDDLPAFLGSQGVALWKLSAPESQISRPAIASASGEPPTPRTLRFPRLA